MELTNYNPMEQSPSWQANSSSAIHEIPRHLWNPKLTTAFTSARHLSLSSDRSIQSMPLYPTSWRSTLLSFHLHLGLPGGLLPSGLSSKILQTPLLSPVSVQYPAHLIIIDGSPEWRLMRSTDASWSVLMVLHNCIFFRSAVSETTTCSSTITSTRDLCLPVTNTMLPSTRNQR